MAPTLIFVQYFIQSKGRQFTLQLRPKYNTLNSYNKSLHEAGYANELQTKACLLGTTFHLLATVTL
jgi:hypothetical protein